MNPSNSIKDYAQWFRASTPYISAHRDKTFVVLVPGDAVPDLTSIDIDAAADENALEDIRVKVLGKKGTLSLRMKDLGKMSNDERKVMGPALNGLKARLNDAIATRQSALHNAALDAKLGAGPGACSMWKVEATATWSDGATYTLSAGAKIRG